MSIQLAAMIVQRLGPCRIALDRRAFADFTHELALAGCDPVDVETPGRGRTAGFLQWRRDDVGAAFAAALKPFSDMDALILHSAGQPRHQLETALFAAGWQRHPGGMNLGEYVAWSAQRLPSLSYYVRAGQAGGALLRSGVLADAAIARHAMAATHVRPGDHVMIDGPAASDGAAILSALSRGGSFMQAPAALGDVPDHSLDMIAAFEPDCGGDWAARIADYARLLKFDGRLILGWPASPGDNRRPQNWDSLVEIVSQWMLPEVRYVQAPVSVDPSGPHMLRTVPLDQQDEQDWLILVAAANPLAGEGHSGNYDHPAFPAASGPWPVLVDFGAAYDNPYLYRAMVQMGERIGHELTIARLAECVIEDARPDSADRGAALAVLGYRILEMRRPDLAASILPVIGDYVGKAKPDAPPHVRRWRISLAFLLGRLNELTGDRAEARRWYRQAGDADWEGFSPLLTTKAIAAAFYEARLCLCDGDTESALARFRSGLDTALKAVACQHKAQMGPDDRPLSFYMQELAEVIDMGSQCANAITHFALWQRDPGLFWRQVDIRRFGLASWARDLERENARLMAA